MQKKGLEFASGVELAKLKFTYITVLKQPKLGHIAKEFLKNYENLKNLFFLKTLLIRISQ